MMYCMNSSLLTNMFTFSAICALKVLLCLSYRKSFLRKRRAAVVLQKHWRGYMEGTMQRKV